MNTEQTVSAAVAGLQLGDTFTFDELLRSVQDQRHRRHRVIELADLDTHDGLCALWLATETDDLVLHARTDSTLHRQQFILHELAHMILGHCDGDDCAVGIRGSVFAESAPGLTPKAGDRASWSGIYYATPADAGLHARDITITTPAGPCPAWRIDGDTDPSRHARRVRTDPALTSTPTLSPGPRRAGVPRRRPHPQLELRPRPVAGSSDDLASSTCPALIAERSDHPRHPSRSATPGDIQLKPYIHRYHRECWLAWAIERGRTNVAEPWLSADDIVAHFGVTKDAVYTWIAEKAMPAHKVGRLWKFQASEIGDWVRRGGAAADSEPSAPG